MSSHAVENAPDVFDNQHLYEQIDWSQEVEDCLERSASPSYQPNLVHPNEAVLGFGKLDKILEALKRELPPTNNYAAEYRNRENNGDVVGLAYMQPAVSRLLRMGLSASDLLYSKSNFCLNEEGAFITQFIPQEAVDLIGLTLKESGFIEHPLCYYNHLAGLQHKDRHGNPIRIENETLSHLHRFDIGMVGEDLLIMFQDPEHGIPKKQLEAGILPTRPAVTNLVGLRIQHARTNPTAVKFFSSRYSTNSLTPAQLKTQTGPSLHNYLRHRLMPEQYKLPKNFSDAGVDMEELLLELINISTTEASMVSKFTPPFIMSRALRGLSAGIEVAQQMYASFLVLDGALYMASHPEEFPLNNWKNKYQ